MKVFLFFVGFFVALFAGLQHSYAMTLTTLYFGDGRLECGVILSVDKHHLWLMNTAGVLEKRSRYDVFGVANYHFSQSPFAKMNFANAAFPVTTFETFEAGERKILAEGWPTGFDSEAIQVLTKSGAEVVIARNAIWGLWQEEFNGEIELTNARAQSVVLRNPLAFENYPKISFGEAVTSVALIPQESFQDPLTIKLFFDKYEAGYRGIDTYRERQRFYALPHYFPNRTYLGTWYLLGSRSVQAGARRVNFLPYVQTSNHSGPFSFQYELISGTSPRSWGVDYEPMAQVAFSMKDAYFAFDAFFDPMTLLLGSKYQWSQAQLGPVDSRLISPNGGRMGIDWKYFSLQLGFLSVEHGVRLNNVFARSAPSHIVLSASSRIDKLFVEFNSISSRFSMDTGDWNFENYGTILRLPANDRVNLDFRYSLRTLTLLSDTNEKGAQQFKEVNHDLAALTSFHIDNRWRLQNLLIVDRQTVQGKLNNASLSKEKVYVKFGLGGALYF